MSPPIIEYGYVEGVEDPSAYRAGGYHPIHIDDHLHQRYRIVHKLGYGTFSTIWLAFDKQTSKYVAIKVGIAHADGKEADILSRLTTGATAGGKISDDISFIPVVADRFTLDGPNGTHPCLVTSLARCSLRDAQERSGRGLFQLDVARSLAAQLVSAICIVHSRGYCHGDLHLGNLLLQMPSSLNSISIKQLYARYGAPEPERVVRLDGKRYSSSPGVPSHVILPVWLGLQGHEINLAEAKLLLNDFGVAFRPADKSHFRSQTPLVIRPPESFFEPTTPLSFGSDIWSLGCTIFEILAHRSLIDGIIAPQDDITAQQVHLQGPMPADWWNRWDKRSKWFNETGKPLSNECDIWSWNRRFEQWINEPRESYGMEFPDEEEKAALLELLKRMIAWKPTDRPSAQEVLNSSWMREWALPAYRASQKGPDGQL